MKKYWFEEELLLSHEILPQLDLGRSNWDRPHTEAVVYWAKEILKSIKGVTGIRSIKGKEQQSGNNNADNDPQKYGSDPGIDPMVVVTAAYAHDWGYIGLIPPGTDRWAMLKMKPKHMEVGAKKIGDLLRLKFIDGYTSKQIDRIIHLVGVHDKLSELKDEDEILLAEADTLGMLDIDRVKPTYNKLENEDFMNEVEHKRLPLFRHQRALEAYEQLMKRRLGYYE